VGAKTLDGWVTGREPKLALLLGFHVCVGLQDVLRARTGMVTTAVLVPLVGGTLALVLVRNSLFVLCSAQGWLADLLAWGSRLFTWLEIGDHRDTDETTRPHSLKCHALTHCGRVVALASRLSPAHLPLASPQPTRLSPLSKQKKKDRAS
jgi:hypothetical protein